MFVPGRTSHHEVSSTVGRRWVPDRREEGNIAEGAEKREDAEQAVTRVERQSRGCNREAPYFLLLRVLSLRRALGDIASLALSRPLAPALGQGACPGVLTFLVYKIHNTLHHAR